MRNMFTEQNQAGSRKSFRLSLVGVGVTVAVVGGVLFAAPGAAFADTESGSSDIVNAIQDASPTGLDDAANLPVNTTQDVAVQEVKATSSVAVPSDPSDGITLGGGSSSLPSTAINIGLPFADQADSAQVVTNGAVSYDNGNGSTTVPVIKSDGTLQISTVIANSAAPSSYAYPISVPDGGSIALADNGSAVVFNADQDVIAAVLPPWAKDATGADIPTHFEVDGNTLVQVVDFSGSGIAFPVVADPQFALYGGILPSIKLNKHETAQASTFTTIGTICGQVTKYLGYLAGILCGVSALQIIAKSAQNTVQHQCSQLVPEPGLVLAVSYSGGYCK